MPIPGCTVTEGTASLHLQQATKCSCMAMKRTISQDTIVLSIISDKLQTLLRGANCQIMMMAITTNVLHNCTYGWLRDGPLVPDIPQQRKLVLLCCNVNIDSFKPLNTEFLLRRARYKDSIRTSQETHYISATKS
jgi:hypothetical protein